VLYAALQHTRAGMGNVQLFDPARRGLYIAAQRGFHRPFVDCFAWVSDERSACGAAAARGEPVTVTDVARSRLFGDPERKVVWEAGIRALQAVPLVRLGRPAARSVVRPLPHAGPATGQ